MTNEVNFPFRIITKWIHPSDVHACQACKKPGNTYTIENYIDMVKMIGTTAFTKLGNDPWIKAINGQARKEFAGSFTCHMCTACLNELHIARYGKTDTWQKALYFLNENYGELAVVEFILVNDYEDEGVTFWSVVGTTDSILDVAQFVADIEVPSHKSKPTTAEDIQGTIKDVERFARKHGKPVKIFKRG